MLFGPYVCFRIFIWVRVAGWPPVVGGCSLGLWCVSGCRCLVVSLVFPTSVFGVVIFF